MLHSIRKTLRIVLVCGTLTAVSGGAAPVGGTSGSAAAMPNQPVAECLECYVIGQAPHAPDGWILMWGAFCDPELEDNCASCESSLFDCQHGEECCWQGPCDWDCLPEERALRIDFYEPADVVRALESYPEHISYNAKRNAIQVVGCSGEIERSISASQSVRAAVLDFYQNQQARVVASAADVSSGVPNAMKR